MERKLYRSGDDRMIWGVCGGLAKYFNVDPALVRVVMVLLIFANGFAILAYIVLAIITPLEPSAVRSTGNATKDNPGEMSSTFAGQEGESPHGTAKVEDGYRRRQLTMGIVLLVVGALFMLGNLGWFSWFRWGMLWPLPIIAIGLIVILAARR